MNIRNTIIYGVIFSLSIAVGLNVKANTTTKDKEVVVVIDPGHGGKDAGAIDNNVKEKDINLGVAKKLAAYIKKELKNAKVVMTRDNDTFISLQERANIANKNKGNLFISIHTNSLDKTNANRKNVAGASVYALGLHKDKNNLQVAMRENSVIELEKDYEQKYSGFDPSKDESYIIFEMAQKKNLGQSLKFADYAQKHLVKDAGRKDRGVKQAGFWVLWATSMPSVLVELDFICNPNSAVFMGSEQGQEKLAKALAAAVKQYFASHSSESAQVEIPAEDKVNNATNTQSESAVLAAATPSAKKTSVSTQSSRRATTQPSKRRRRSENARQTSSNRNVETESIPIGDENARLALIEEKKAPAVEETQQSVASNVDKKKDKNKKQKKAKADKSKTKKYHAKVEKLKTLYKIQILASADLLKQNNPRFCGLSPVKSFRENNLYKYTYGESENRKEIETLLKKVKEKIPDAFIITYRK